MYKNNKLLRAEEAVDNSGGGDAKPVESTTPQDKEPTTPQEKPKPELFSLSTTDNQVHHDVTADEMHLLAQMGLDQYVNKSKPTEKKETIVDDDPDVKMQKTLEGLQSEITGLKNSIIQKDQYGAMNQALANEIQNNEFTRANPAMAKEIAASALSQFQMNPRITLVQHFQNSAKVHEDLVVSKVEEENKRLTATKKISSITLGNVLRGEATIPAFEVKESLGMDHVKSGKSRLKLEEMLEGAMAPGEEN